LQGIALQCQAYIPECRIEDNDGPVCLLLAKFNKGDLLRIKNFYAQDRTIGY